MQIFDLLKDRNLSFQFTQKVIKRQQLCIMGKRPLQVAAVFYEVNQREKLFVILFIVVLFFVIIIIIIFLTFGKERLPALRAEVIFLEVEIS